MAATKRTAKTGETIPPVSAVNLQVVGQSFFRGKQVKLICPQCALEYCPNFHQYARLDTPLAASQLQLGVCDICGGKNGKFSGGVSDPANYGGMRSGL